MIFTLVFLGSEKRDTYTPVLDWVSHDAEEMIISLHRGKKDRTLINEFQAWSKTAKPGEILESKIGLFICNGTGV